jgi:hypothetical protein
MFRQRTNQSFDVNFNSLSHLPSVDLNSQPNKVSKISGKFLSTQTDILRRDSCRNRPTDLKTRRGINVNALGMKEFQYGRVGRGLHGVSDRQTIGIGKGETCIRRSFKFLQRVGIKRAAGLFDASLGCFRGQKDRFVRIGHVNGNRSSSSKGSWGESIACCSDSKCKKRACSKAHGNEDKMKKNQENLWSERSSLLTKEREIWIGIGWHQKCLQSCDV